MLIIPLIVLCRDKFSAIFWNSQIFQAKMLCVLQHI